MGLPDDRDDRRDKDNKEDLGDKFDRFKEKVKEKFEDKPERGSTGPADTDYPPTAPYMRNDAGGEISDYNRSEWERRHRHETDDSMENRDRMDRDITSRTDSDITGRSDRDYIGGRADDEDTASRAARTTERLTKNYIDTDQDNRNRTGMDYADRNNRTTMDSTGRDTRMDTDTDWNERKDTDYPDRHLSERDRMDPSRLDSRREPDRSQPMDRTDYKVSKDVAKSGARTDTVTANRADDYSGNATYGMDPTGARAGDSNFSPTGDRTPKGVGVLERPESRTEDTMDHDDDIRNRNLNYDRDRDYDRDRETVGDKVDNLKERAEDKIEDWKDKAHETEEERLRKQRDKARAEADIQKERADLLKKDREDY